MTTNSSKNKSEFEFGPINLKDELHVIAPGRYKAQIADVRLVRSRDGNTLWCFITLDIFDADGVVVGQVEDRFITIAVREGSEHAGRLLEGLRRLRMYESAAGVGLDDRKPDDIGALLIGEKIRASISRRGVGVQAENRVGGIWREVE